MWGSLGLCLLSVYLVSSSEKLVGINIDGGRSRYERQKEVIDNNVIKTWISRVQTKIQNVLSHISAMRAVHPRLHRLYELLNKDVHQEKQYNQHHGMGFNKIL